MPVRQIPLISKQGIYQDNDNPGVTSDYRYFFNGYFEEADSTENSRKYAYVKRPGMNTVFVTGLANGHYVQGFISSVDKTTQVLYSNTGATNKTWFISSGVVTDKGTVSGWTNTGPVIFTQLDGISYGVSRLSVSSITRNGSTATCTTTSNHKAVTGDSVTISGATETEYNGTFTITVTGATTFTYTVSGTPDAPATGTIFCDQMNYYAATDFTKGAVITASGAWFEIADTDFTTRTVASGNMCTNFCALDGYLFYGTTTNRIYNSDLNAAANWGALAYITASDTPGRLMWLSKIRNYLIVFKDKSIEFYENVGNATPGSPLEARKYLNKNVGCLNRSSIQEVSDGIIFAGVANNGATAMYKLSKEDLSLRIISDRYVEQCLPTLKVPVSATTYSVDAIATAALLGTQFAFQGESQSFNLFGKEFYTINVKEPNDSSDKITLVYDNKLGIWTSWQTNHRLSGTPYGFEASQAQPITVGTTYQTTGWISNVSVGGSSPAKIFCFNQSAPEWTDEGTDGTNRNYSFGWTSDIFDFGSRRRKFMDSFEVLYTSDSSVAPSHNTTGGLNFKYRDWDYNTTTNYVVTRSIDFDPGSGVRAIARRLGSFRRRNFNIWYSGNSALTIWGIEVQYNQGETDQES